MAKPTIVTRAGKGSALTWTEGDTNLTNLRDATITVTDGTNSKAIDLNGTITFTAGTNVTLSVNSSTGAVTINSSNPGGTVTSVAALTLGTTGTDVSSTVATGTTTPVITLNIPTASASNRGALSSTDWSTFNGKQAALVSGTSIKTVNSTSLLGSGDVSVGVTSVGGTGTVSGLSLSGTVTSTGNLTLGGTLDLSSPPAIGGTAAAAISATTLTFKDPREAIYNIGTTGGTIAPNVSNGSVQKITLNSALTINAFTSPQAGQSLTLIIYGGTAYTSITSTMLFAGGIKTLTGTAGCIDILSVYYDGTNYFASLNKGFA